MFASRDEELFFMVMVSKHTCTYQVMQKHPNCCFHSSNSNPMKIWYAILSYAFCNLKKNYISSNTSDPSAGFNARFVNRASNSARSTEGAFMGTSTSNGMHEPNDQAVVCSGNCLEIQDANKLILYYNHYNY